MCTKCLKKTEMDKDVLKSRQLICKITSTYFIIERYIGKSRNHLDDTIDDEINQN